MIRCATMRTTNCKCGQVARAGQRDCNSCHNSYMREWRKTHPLSPEERLKMNARAYAHVYLKRGQIDRLPCVVCGDAHSQMHHPDYHSPLVIVWLCRAHHMLLH